MKLFIFDYETWLIEPGIAAPRPVCLTYLQLLVDENSKDLGCLQGPAVLLTADPGTDALEEALDDPDTILANHHIFFDLAVAAVYRPRLLPKIFAALRDDRVRCTKVRQQLLDIKDGCLFFKRPSSGTQGYGMAALEQHYKVGRDRTADKADENHWRKRFRELDGVAIKDYPKEASEYCREDVVNLVPILYGQTREARADNYLDEPSSAASPWPLIVNEREQLRAAWCLQLLRVHGFITEEEKVKALEAEIMPQYLALQQKMFEEGLYELVRADEEDVAKGKVVCYQDREIVRARIATRAEVVDGANIELQPRSAKNPELVRKLVYRHTVSEPMRYKRSSAAIQARVAGAYLELGQMAPRTESTERYPNGQISTDSDALELSGDPLLAELGGGGPVATVVKTFLPVLKSGTNPERPITAEFNVLVETGRPSASKPNVFNFPRQGGVRECVIPRKGKWLCSVDYDCAELRSHAQYNYRKFGWGRQADFFRSNPHGDPHLELAAAILSLPVEEATRRLKAGDEEVKGARQMCKAINFGLPGGMGVDKLIESARRGYGITIERAKAFKMVEAWFGRWPEMKAFFEYVGGVCGRSGGASIEQWHPQGKPHRRRGNVDYCAACNTFFQGLTADGAKHALWKAMWEMYCEPTSDLYGSRVIIFLYDEIMAEVPEGPAGDRAARRLAVVMREAMGEWLPDVPTTCEPALMLRWSKKAAYRENERGELIPWDLPKTIDIPKMISLKHKLGLDVRAA